MGTGGWVGAAATTALRRGSPGELASGVARYLEVARRTRLGPCDVLAGLAPFLDCARRLGEDPAALVERAAEGVEPELAGAVRELAGRADVELEAYGWTLAETPAGPEYVAVPPIGRAGSR
jgi:hypothetical protein